MTETKDSDVEDGRPLLSASEDQLMPSPAVNSTTTSKRFHSTSSTSGMNSNQNEEDLNHASGDMIQKRVKRLRKKRMDTTDSNTVIKYGSLILLVAQMVGLVLLMRYSRTHTKKGEDLYLASSAVFMMELMKFIVCNVVVLIQSKYSIHQWISELYDHVWRSPDDMLKLCIPSLLYTVQNNLLYLALSNLDAATYQVCYQLKILTTALFSVIMLKREFSGQKWLSLLILTLGVAIVQLSGDSKEGIRVEDQKKSHNRLIGLVAVFCAACTSGFAGVYFEKILKGSTTTLWIRNIQMGLPSMVIALMTVFIEDRQQVFSKGFLVGYTPLVWTVVSVQAIGGLIVAVVVKYADNVLKVFATSFSIIFSCLMSASMSDFTPTFWFDVGAFLVVISSVMYSKPDKSIRTRRLKRSTGLTSTLPLVNSDTKRIS